MNVELGAVLEAAGIPVLSRLGTDGFFRLYRYGHALIMLVLLRFVLFLIENDIKQNDD